MFLNDYMNKIPSNSHISRKKCRFLYKLPLFLFQGYKNPINRFFFIIFLIISRTFEENPGFMCSFGLFLPDEYGHFRSQHCIFPQFLSNK